MEPSDLFERLTASGVFAIALPAAFILVILGSAAATAILDYHWRRYGVDARVVGRLRRAYAITGVAIGAALIGAQLMYFLP